MIFPDIVQDCARQGTIFDITPVVESVPVDCQDAHFRDYSSMTATCVQPTCCLKNVQRLPQPVIHSRQSLRHPRPKRSQTPASRT
jgi:hypothetical protein